LFVCLLRAAVRHVTGLLFASISADCRLSLWRLEAGAAAYAPMALHFAASLIVDVDDPLALDVAELADEGGVVFAVAGAGLQTLYLSHAAVMAYAAC
jgi:hypothetical protein